MIHAPPAAGNTLDPADRPGPQPHNAGITRGYEHLVDDDRPARLTRREVREMRAAILALTREVAALTRGVAT